MKSTWRGDGLIPSATIPLKISSASSTSFGVTNILCSPGVISSARNSLSPTLPVSLTAATLHRAQCWPHPLRWEHRFRSPEPPEFPGKSRSGNASHEIPTDPRIRQLGRCSSASGYCGLPARIARTISGCVSPTIPFKISTVSIPGLGHNPGRNTADHPGKGQSF